MIYNNPLSDIEKLQKYAEKSNDAFIINDTGEQLFIHFTNEEIVFPRIMTKWDTPVGVYAYLLTNGIFEQWMSRELPFQNDARYVYLLKRKSAYFNINTSDDITDEELDEFKEYVYDYSNTSNAFIALMEKLANQIACADHRNVYRWLPEYTKVAPVDFEPYIAFLEKTIRRVDLFRTGYLSDAQNNANYYRRIVGRIRQNPDELYSLLHAADLLYGYILLYEIIAVSKTAHFTASEQRDIETVNYHIMFMASGQKPEGTANDDVHRIIRKYENIGMFGVLKKLFYKIAFRAIVDGRHEIVRQIVEFGQHDAKKCDGVVTNLSKLWNITRLLANENPRLWNTILRAIGIRTIIDDAGHGLIHPNEPQQAVFLTPESYYVENVIRNPSQAVAVKTRVVRQERHTEFLAKRELGQNARLVLNDVGMRQLEVDIRSLLHHTGDMLGGRLYDMAPLRIREYLASVYPALTLSDVEALSVIIERRLKRSTL